jgi:flagellar FliL protein
MAEEQKSTPTDSASNSKPLTSPLVLAILVLNTVGLAAVAFFLFSYIKQERARPAVEDLIKEQVEASKDHGGKDELKKEETAKVDHLEVVLEPFSVNLAQGDGPRRYLRLNAVLKFSHDALKDEVEARKPQIRDAVINILNAKRPEDLLKREGKLFLKDEIKSSINSFLVKGKVEDLYYTGFQIN